MASNIRKLNHATKHFICFPHFLKTFFNTLIITKSLTRSLHQRMSKGDSSSRNRPIPKEYNRRKKMRTNSTIHDNAVCARRFPAFSFIPLKSLTDVQERGFQERSGHCPGNNKDCGGSNGCPCCCPRSLSHGGRKEDEASRHSNPDPLFSRN